MASGSNTMSSSTNATSVDTNVLLFGQRGWIDAFVPGRERPRLPGDGLYRRDPTVDDDHFTRQNTLCREAQQQPPEVVGMIPRGNDDGQPPICHGGVRRTLPPLIVGLGQARGYLRGFGQRTASMSARIRSSSGTRKYWST